jgi:hypothetical protein
MMNFLIKISAVKKLKINNASTYNDTAATTLALTDITQNLQERRDISGMQTQVLAQGRFEDSESEGYYHHHYHRYHVYPDCDCRSIGVDLSFCTSASVLPISSLSREITNNCNMHIGKNRVCLLPCHGQQV